MSIFEFLDPIIYDKREQPYPEITERHTVLNINDNKILLTEIPSKFNGVEVKKVVNGIPTGQLYIVITQGTPQSGQVHVDYMYGICTFNSEENNNIFEFKFFGTGIKYFPSQRVWVMSDGLKPTKNLKQFIDETEFNINTTNQNHTNHLNSSSAHGSNSISNQSTVTGSKVSDALNTLKTNHESHLNSTTAHKDDSINNTSVVAGTKVKDALNSLKTKDDQLNSRIDNIISQSGTSSTEVVDARNSAKYGTFVSLDARLEGIETRSKYFARENHTVLTNASTITLTNLPENNHELLIYDTKYGAIWNKTQHWTRSGATITFTSLMPEDLNFVVINLG